MIGPNEIARYWHTVRHLRPVQVYGRLWFRVARPRVDTRDAPPCRRAETAQWALPARREPTLVGRTQLRLLGETRDLETVGWDDPSLEKLWRYHLHYFDDLNAQDAAARTPWHQALLTRWVRENPPGSGTGWEPYPTSLRVVNWAKWALRGNSLPLECIHSLAVQCRWLARRLELHLLGNHLFANAKALVFAGLFFEGDEAAAWLERGLRILEREVPEQFLADGGHFERSTMYHALALEDMLDLCNLTDVFRAALSPRRLETIDGWRSRIAPMQAWLAAMSHPDGDIALFNDAAIGIAPTPAELAMYAARLGLPVPAAAREGVTHLAASGYIRLEHGAAVVLLDVAPVGPDYLPGHAHADTLSFELSLSGQRIVVNSGTSCYGRSTERCRQRGTAAHSTLQIDGADSSEVWSGFRVARRARPFGLLVSSRPGESEVTCSHDGYKRLPSSPIHSRCWRLTPESMHVVDTVTGNLGQKVVRFFFHPGVEARLVHHGLTLQPQHGAPIDLRWTGGSGRIVRSTWHPGFGDTRHSSCLEVLLHGNRLDTVLRWPPAAAHEKARATGAPMVTTHYGEP